MYKITVNKSVAEDFANTYARGLFSRIVVLHQGIWTRTNCLFDWFFGKFTTEDEVKGLLLADFNEQKNILKEMTEYAIQHNSKWRNKGFLKLLSRNEYKEFAKFIEDAFVKDGYETIDKDLFVKNLNVRICPYCGRSYIYAVDKPNANGEKGVVKHQIDHFLNKGQYPMFAMSFYNLIPSCVVCNMNPCKGKRNVFIDDNLNTEIMHPYEFDDDKFSFKVKLTNANYFDESSYDIVTTSNNANYKDGYDKFFAIEPLYKEHALEAKYLWMRKRKWNESSLEYIRNNVEDKDAINMYFRAFFSFHKSEKTDKEQLLSKFYKDIFKQLPK